MRKWLITGALTGMIFFSSGVEASASSYQVKSGDTLWLIGQKYGVSVSELVTVNNLNGYEIYPGQTIAIHGNGAPRKHTVQAGESLWVLANNYRVTVSQIQNWNQLASTTIYPGQSLVVSTSGQVQSSFTQEEKDLLARLVYAESRGEPYKGKVAVAAVVLNRMNHSDFPSSLNGVVYESFESGTIFAFEPVQNGAIYRSADAESRKAVNDAINGYDPTNGAIYFFNPETATSNWVNRLTINQRIGNHVFAF